MAQAGSFLCAMALFVLGQAMFAGLPWAGHRILTNVGGTTLGWSVTLLALAAAWFIGSLVARIIRFAPWRPIQVLLAATLLVAATVWPFTFTALPANAEAWSRMPELAGLVYFGLLAGIPVVALSAIAMLLPGWFRRADSNDSAASLSLFWLGGLAGLLVFAVILEPTFGLSEFGLQWRIVVPVAGGMAVAIGFIAPFLTGPATPAATATPAPIAVTWPKRLFWLLCGFVPIALLIGQTQFATSDIAPSTYFWIVPLGVLLVAAAQGLSGVSLSNRVGLEFRVAIAAVYFLLLAGAIVVAGYQLFQFDPNGVVIGAGLAVVLIMPKSWLPFVQPLAALAAIGLCAGHRYGLMPIVVQLMAVYLTSRLIFGEAKHTAPGGERSTSFHSWLAAGAVLGAAFQIVLAPHMFPPNMQVTIMLALGCAIRPAWLQNGAFDHVVMAVLPKSYDWRDSARRQSLARWFDALVGVGIAVVVATMMWLTQFNADNLVARMAGPADFRLRDALSMIFRYGPVFIVSLAVGARPVRFGCAVLTIVCCAPLFLERPGDRNEIRRQSRFATLKVFTRDQADAGFANWQSRSLMNGTTMHAAELIDNRRQPTTYFHDNGPVGQTMRRFKWFPSGGHESSDARICASMVAQAAAGLGTMPAPLDAAVVVWSEPPIAMIGMDAGTFAAYARPFQRIDFYELDPGVVALSDDAAGGKEPLFHFVGDAVARGAIVRVFPGDARRALKELGPKGFYKVLLIAAFNSDAIPIHYMTRQAVDEYANSLADDGVLLFHTSNRYTDLPNVLKPIAQKMKWTSAIAHDDAGGIANPKFAPAQQRLWFSSQWLAMAREKTTIDAARSRLFQFEDGDKNFRRNDRFAGPIPLWSDDYADPDAGMRDRSFFEFLYAAAVALMFVVFWQIGAELLFAVLPPPRLKPVVAKVERIDDDPDDAEPAPRRRRHRDPDDDEDDDLPRRRRQHDTE